MYEYFCEEIRKTFGKRVVSLLYYGSNAFASKQRSEFSDFDFCLVLDRRHPKDLLRIKRLTTKSNGIDLTLHYLDDLEAIGWNRFQHGNHGTFFLLHLASAKTILGVNIFARKIPVLENADIKESLVRQIIEYFWRLDHWYFEGNDAKETVRKFRKYLIRVAQDLLVSQGDISFEEINHLDSDKFITDYIANKKYLSKSTKTGFNHLRSDKATIDDCIKLKISLYEDFRSLFIGNV